MNLHSHFIEQWKDKQGNYHFTKPKPLNEFNRALSKSKYGFKTIAIFKIKYKKQIN
jgi:hypothetical protein